MADYPILQRRIMDAKWIHNVTMYVGLRALSVRMWQFPGGND